MEKPVLLKEGAEKLRGRVGPMKNMLREKLLKAEPAAQGSNEGLNTRENTRIKKPRAPDSDLRGRAKMSQVTR